MTTPEQEAMTLEERELVVNVLRNYHRDHTGDPEFGVWPQIAHGLAGRFATPATRRDVTAGLIEAVIELCDSIDAIEGMAPTLTQEERQGRWNRHDAAVHEVRRLGAVLARVKGETT